MLKKVECVVAWRARLSSFIACPTGSARASCGAFLSSQFAEAMGGLQFASLGTSSERVLDAAPSANPAGRGSAADARGRRCSTQGLTGGVVAGCEGHSQKWRAWWSVLRESRRLCEDRNKRARRRGRRASALPLLRGTQAAQGGGGDGGGKWQNLSGAASASRGNGRKRGGAASPPPRASASSPAAGEESDGRGGKESRPSGASGGRLTPIEELSEKTVLCRAYSHCLRFMRADLLEALQKYPLQEEVGAAGKARDQRRRNSQERYRSGVVRLRLGPAPDFLLLF